MPIFLSKTSLKYLAKLEKATRSKIVTAVEGLPDKGDIKKMRGPGPPNLFRLRIGKYRVLYTWEEDIIRIIDIDTRGDIYK
jgi:mRNA interferase RelE/StbE